jgi:hypothetical protein
MITCVGVSHLLRFRTNDHGDGCGGEVLFHRTIFFIFLFLFYLSRDS